MLKFCINNIYRIQYYIEYTELLDSIMMTIKTDTK